MFKTSSTESIELLELLKNSIYKKKLLILIKLLLIKY
jgi:hypothetical protein